MPEDIVINGTTYPDVSSLQMNNSNGEKVVFYPDAVRYNPQTLTNEQKIQARSNIGAANAEAVESLSKEIADKVSKTGITLGLHSDGKYYVFIDGAPVGTGFELSGNSGDVFGYVDENNNIVLNGSLADGSYNIKYEMEDGRTVDIGNLVLDSNVYYSVTNNLTNCKNSNNDTQVIEGQAYTATITANSGYELKSVTVTMGGNPVTVSGGNINIANITGNIVITAVAEEIKAKYTNLADPTSADWLENTRISSSGFPAQTGITTSNWIAITNGDVVRIKGIDVNTHQYARVALFGSTKNLLSSAKISGLTSADVTGVTYDTTGAQFTIASTNAKFIRVCGELNGNAEDVIITVNEEIA